MRSILVFILFSLFTNLSLANESLEDEAVAWLQAYLKVDTINPPGNESRAVDFYAEIFRKEGIEFG